MGTAEIILNVATAIRLLVDLLDRVNREEMTDEERQAAWEAMQTHLTSVSARIRA